ncbi:TPA: SH3 domain-containing protein [Photobacterium damselae]
MSQVSSIKEAAETIKSFRKQHREMMKVIEAVRAPVIQYREMMKAIEAVRAPAIQHREMMKAVEAVRAPAIQHREMMKAIEAVRAPVIQHREMMKAIEAVRAPVIQHREMMKAIEAVRVPTIQHREMMNIIKANRESISQINVGVFDGFKEDFVTVNNNVEVTEQGEVVFNEQSILYSELQQISDDVISRSFSVVSDSFSKSIDRLALEISKQNDPALQKFLNWIIYPLIVGCLLSVINPVSENWVNSRIQTDKRVVAKSLNHVVRDSSLDQNEVKSFRYVSADVLNIRSEPTIKAAVIGQLQFSSVVRVIDKQKKWTFIEWQSDESDSLIRGWVFTRYLNKFR